MKFSDIEYAYIYVDVLNDNSGIVVSMSESKICYFVDEDGNIDNTPADINDAKKYIRVPKKYDLDLDKKLVWKFVDIEMPELYDKVSEIFSRSGAYARYKSFLQEVYLLDKWYEFKNIQTQEALRKWCFENKIEVEV